MTDEAAVKSPHKHFAGQIGTRASAASRHVSSALVIGAAFSLYWFSSFILHARKATMHFGADAHVYTLLAQGIVVDDLTRFHPVTIGAAVAWMKILHPLTLWIAPHQILKAMFA